jgi:hypothetical protein
MLVSAEEKHEEKHIEEEEKERARRTGVEGVLARKYPELYAELKELAERTGRSVLDLMASYTHWALELRRYSSIVTEEELKKVTPEALHAALKMILFFEERYIRLASYANIATATQVFEWLRTLYYPYPQATSQPQAVPIVPPPPQPDRVSQIINAVLRAIEMFSMGSEEVRRQLAREIAEELARVAGQGQKPSGEKK